MVKSRALKTSSELNDFASETRDIVLSYFSLLPIQPQEGNLVDSLKSLSSSSSRTRGEWVETQAGSQEKHEKNHRRTEIQQYVSPGNGHGEAFDVDTIDGKPYQRVVQKSKRYGRSISCDDYNLKKGKKQDEDKNKRKCPLENCDLLSEPKHPHSRARSVSPIRPSSLDIIPVYPPTNSQQNNKPHRTDVKLDKQLKEVNSSKRIISKDEIQQLKFDILHETLKRQLSSHANKPPSDRKLISSGSRGSSLQNSLTNSIDRRSLNSDVSNSKSQSSRNSETVMSVLDWEDEEVKKLVEGNVVSPVALSLKHAIEETIAESPVQANSLTREPARPSDFGKRLSGSLNSKITRSQQTRSLTPQTEVAHMIAAIGDQIEQEYGHILSMAIISAAALPDESLVPETLEEIVSREGFMNREEGWKKPVMLLKFCKGLALEMISKNRSLGRLLDSTVEMLADSAADFVLRQGGWPGILSENETPTTHRSSESTSSDEHEELTAEWNGEGEQEYSKVDGVPNDDVEELQGAVGGTGQCEQSNTVDGSNDERQNILGAEDRELEQVRMEIWLMRQISEQYNEENHSRYRFSFIFKAALSLFGLATLGGVFVLLLKQKQFRTLLSFFKK